MSYVRVGIIGALAGGEVWSVNPVFDPNGEFPGAVNQASLDAAAQAIANLSPGVNLKSLMSASVSIVGARVEVRDDVSDGLLAISTAASSPAIIGSGTLFMPPQNAVVVSLRTDTPGARGRGRIYWPACAVGIGANFRIAPTLPPLMLADFKTYFTAIEGILATNFPLIGFDLAVRSKVAKATPHVVRLQIGDVIDTQRRRRDTYVESYTTVSM